jgi:DNA-binding transcriptional MerR regulator
MPASPKATRRRPSTPRGASAPRLKMKDLERLTGVGREAIRFYIREGLLPEPERPARNVAYYDLSFVERIRLIKRLQQERFLPLEMIKGMLGVRDVPPAAEVETLLALDGQIDRDSGRPPRPPESPSGLARRVALPAAEVRELARLGAIEIVTRDGRQWVEGTSVEVVELWARMRSSGFTADLGFGPEHVGMSVQMVEWLAREQLRLFTRQVTGRVDREKARAMAEVGLECVTQLTKLLHESTLLRLIASGNLPASSEEETVRRRPKAS